MFRYKGVLLNRNKLWYVCSVCVLVLMLCFFLCCFSFIFLWFVLLVLYLFVGFFYIMFCLCWVVFVLVDYWGGCICWCLCFFWYFFFCFVFLCWFGSYIFVWLWLWVCSWLDIIIFFVIVREEWMLFLCWKCWMCRNFVVFRGEDNWVLGWRWRGFNLVYGRVVYGGF